MKLSKILGAAAIAALALMAFAGTASATTLDTNGVLKTTSTTLHATLQSGTEAKLTDTSGESGTVAKNRQCTEPPRVPVAPR
jgi:hypothetical protein